MPRRAEARKDVVSCDKRRGGAHIPRSVDVRMGEPRTVIPCDPCGEHIAARRPTRGSEPSQYPEEQKAISDSLSSGERNGKSLNLMDAKPAGVVHWGSWDRSGGDGSPFGKHTKRMASGRTLRTGEPKSVRAAYAKARIACWDRHPSTTGYEEPCGNLGGPSPKTKYYCATDSEPVP